MLCHAAAYPGPTHPTLLRWRLHVRLLLLLQDAVIFAGDLAYDMEDDGGGVGNAFFNSIQPIASEVPWNVCPGNHEADIGNTYAQYTNR